MLYIVLGVLKLDMRYFDVDYNSFEKTGENLCCWISLAINLFTVYILWKEQEIYSMILNLSTSAIIHLVQLNKKDF